jgi:hypothetical protein
MGVSESIRACDVAGDLFSRMRWEWLRAAPGTHFLTSDAPVIAFNPGGQRAMGPRLGRTSNRGLVSAVTDSGPAWNLERSAPDGAAA